MGKTADTAVMKKFCLLVPLLAAVLFAGCNVSEMSSLKELSRVYAGVYECETLTLGGCDVLGAYEPVRLTLYYGGDGTLSWRQGAGEGELSFTYEASPEEGRVTFFAMGQKRTFCVREGRIVIETPVCGKLLYASFSRQLT